KSSPGRIRYARAPKAAQRCATYVRCPPGANVSFHFWASVPARIAELQAGFEVRGLRSLQIAAVPRRPREGGRRHHLRRRQAVQSRQVAFAQRDASGGCPAPSEKVPLRACAGARGPIESPIFPSQASKSQRLE